MAKSKKTEESGKKTPKTSPAGAEKKPASAKATRPAAGKKKSIKPKSSPAENAAAETPPPADEKSFLTETAGNIEEGAKIFGEKAGEIAGALLGKLRKGVSQAYQASAKVVDELSQTAHDYTEKYKTEMEMKELRGQKDDLTTRLGAAVFKQLKTKGTVRDTFFQEKEIRDVVERVEKLDREIVKLGKKLDQAKK